MNTKPIMFIEIVVGLHLFAFVIFNLDLYLFGKELSVISLILVNMDLIICILL